jgi:hypothetical protein
MAINAPSDYINKVRKGIIGPATTPDVLRTIRRPLPKGLGSDSVQITNTPIKPEPLELHPEPQVNSDHFPYQQLANNVETIFFLAQGLPNIQNAARNLEEEEQKLLGVA